MAISPVDGALVGVPARIDQNGDAFQLRIRQGANLEIPQTGVDRSKLDRRERENRAPLTRDEAFDEAGDAWQTRTQDRLERFENGQRRERRGAVVIDQGANVPSPSGPLVRKPTRPPDEDTEAWTAWKQAHTSAAQSEEYAKDQLAPYMKTPKQARRRYTILNPT